MMGKTSFFILIFILFFSTILIAAEEDKEKEIPVGMERIPVTDSYNLLVPKGTNIHKEGALSIIENINEYVARRFYDTENRIVKIETNVEELKREIKQLKKKLIKTQQTGLSSENQ